ncbi:MAG: TraB/GumN family protein [Chthoniobacterales bacterium]|nr:TraB/GumN family protein [Chthoniobacterales bacterium]
MDLVLRRWQIAADLAASGWLLLIASPSAAGGVVANHKHCLWRVTNAPAPVYLLGSVHALQPSDYIRTPVIEEAIKQSNQILFEMTRKKKPPSSKNSGRPPNFQRASWSRAKYIHRPTNICAR